MAPFPPDSWLSQGVSVKRDVTASKKLRTEATLAEAHARIDELEAEVQRLESVAATSRAWQSKRRGSAPAVRLKALAEEVNYLRNLLEQIEDEVDVWWDVQDLDADLATFGEGVEPDWESLFKMR